MWNALTGISVVIVTSTIVILTILTNDHLDLPDPVVAQAGVVFKVELLQSGDDGNEQFGAPERHSERHHNLHCQVRH